MMLNVLHLNLFSLNVVNIKYYLELRSSSNFKVFLKYLVMRRQNTNSWFVRFYPFGTLWENQLASQIFPSYENIYIRILRFFSVHDCKFLNLHEITSFEKYLEIVGVLKFQVEE